MCLVCAPTDFSTDHFHKLYVCACLGSTTPQGLFQMTGRIRKLQCTTICCCAAKSIAFTGFPPRITVDQQWEHIRCVNQSLAAGCMQNVRVEGGGTAVLPEESALHYVLASNLAKTANGQARFFAEMKLLLEDAGHRVEVVPVEAMGGDARSGSEEEETPSTSRRVECLVAAPTMSEEEYACLQRKKMRHEASEEEKWQLEAYEYCRAWGIKRIDRAFLKANGTRAGSPKVALVARLLHITVPPPPAQVRAAEGGRLTGSSCYKKDRVSGPPHRFKLRILWKHKKACVAVVVVGSRGWATDWKFLL